MPRMPRLSSLGSLALKASFSERSLEFSSKTSCTRSWIVSGSSDTEASASAPHLSRAVAEPSEAQQLLLEDLLQASVLTDATSLKHFRATRAAPGRPRVEAAGPGDGFRTLIRSLKRHQEVCLIHELLRRFLAKLTTSC